MRLQSFRIRFFLVEFDTLELEILVICWIGSVDPVDDLRLTNQIYSVLLNAFEFKEINEAQNAHLQMLLEDDVTSFLQVPDTTMRAS